MVWKKKTIKNQNPYLCDGSVGGHGNKSEDRILKKTKAKQTPGSGAFPHFKSDGIKHTKANNYRIECKATNKKSISLKHEWLIKIRAEAMQTSMIPVLTLSFVELDGKEKKAGDWVCIPDYLWMELISDEND